MWFFFILAGLFFLGGLVPGQPLGGFAIFISAFSVICGVIYEIRMRTLRKHPTSQSSKIANRTAPAIANQDPGTGKNNVVLPSTHPMQRKNPSKQDNGDDWKCGRCGKRSFAKEFCSNCGDRVGVYCPNCHHLTEFSQPYCADCGKDKHQVFLTQKEALIRQKSEGLNNTRRNIEQIQSDLEFINVMGKGCFSPHAGCIRGIGAFLILFGVVSFILANSTTVERASQGGMTQGWISFMLGFVLATIPSMIGYEKEKRDSLHKDQAYADRQKHEIFEIQKKGFIEWCDQLHQLLSERQRQNIQQQNAVREERDDSNDPRAEENARQEMWEKEKELNAEYERKERERQEHNDWIDDMEEEKRKEQEEYENYQRELDEKAKKDEEEDW